MRRALAVVLGSIVLAACGAPEEGRLGEAPEAMKICPSSSTLEGVDVSHWDGAIDWKKVKASGRSWAIAKATEGTGYTDDTFAANWKGTKKEGLVRGAYHFFHANLDPIQQADYFLGVQGALEPGDLPPTLDLEVTDNESPATITKNAIAWLDHVAQATGTKPIVYTSPSFVDGLGNPAGFDQHARLWIANWQVKCPDVPAPFSAYDFWQYDDKGTVDGIGANSVDLDVFNGSMADLQGITVPSPTTSSSSGSSSVGAASSSSGATGATSSSTNGAGSTSSSSGMTSTSTGAGGGDGYTPLSRSGCSCRVAGDERRDRDAASLALVLGLAAIASRRAHRR